MDVTVDTLLKFLYEFAITLCFCLIGGSIKEMVRSSKKKEKIDIKEIITSTVFATFLMVSCAQYIDLPFEVYAFVSIVCGMWGKRILNIFMNEKFISNIFSIAVKSIANPVMKSIAESADEVLTEDIENENNEENKNED